jgi:hypothetical protein
MLPTIVTEPIEVAVTAATPFTLPHGLGRQVAGWLVIWADADVTCHVADPAADSSQELALVPSATCNLRIVLL